MKIKLYESARPYSKVRRNVEKNIIPSLNDMGFNFSPFRATEINKYKVEYPGTYQDEKDGETLLAYMDVSTTHENLTDPDDIFVTMQIGTNIYEIGATSSKDPHTITDLIEYSIENEDLSMQTKDTTLDPESGKDLTLDQWKELIKKKQKELNTLQFKSWVNKIPDDVYEKVYDMRT